MNKKCADQTAQILIHNIDKPSQKNRDLANSVNPDQRPTLYIEIKHDFLCINVCWAPREMLKPEPERRGFQHLPWGPADVNVSEKHVWSLLLHKTFFCLKTLEIASKSSFYLIPIMARKSMLPAKVSKMPLPGKRLTSSLLYTLLMMTSVFMMATECLFVKLQSPALTAHELPC